MAVSWSWAWGTEARGVLSGDMGWTDPDTGGGGGTVAASSAITWTYGGSPTRYAMTCSSYRRLIAPASVFIPEGWLAMPVYCATDWYTSITNGSLFDIVMGSGKRIYGYCSGIAGPVGTISCYIDTTLIGTFTLTTNTWYYLAVKYKVSVNDWSADVYINGVITAATGISVGEGAETVGTYGFGGFSTSALAHVGQMIVYDWAGSGQKDAIYCTRLAPNADTSETGTWAPSAGATNFGVTAVDPFTDTTYTEETTPTSGDDVVTEVQAASLATQTGIAGGPGSVLGTTNHTYSSGAGFQANAAVKDSAGAYATGANVSPAAGTTSYAFGTQTTGITGTSVINFKYEVV